MDVSFKNTQTLGPRLAQHQDEIILNSQQHCQLVIYQHINIQVRQSWRTLILLTVDVIGRPAHGCICNRCWVKYYREAADETDLMRNVAQIVNQNVDHIVYDYLVATSYPQ